MQSRRTDKDQIDTSKHSEIDLSEEMLTHFNLSDISDDDLPIPGSIEKKRILLLCEKNSQLARLESEIQNSGRTTSIAQSFHNLDDALERLNQGDINLVAFQLDTPIFGGIEGVKQIHKSYPEIPIVVLADRGDRNQAIESLKHGAQDYLCSDDLDFDEMIDRVLAYSIERKRAEQVNHLALKLEKATIRSVLEHSPMVMIRVDSDFRVLDCNTAFEKAVGATRDKIKRQILFELIAELNIIGVQEIVLKGNNFKKRIKLKSIEDDNYTAIFWEVSGWPVIRSTQDVHEAIITAVDVTRETFLELERDEFVAALAHDLRNPVSGQILVLEALTKECQLILPGDLGDAFAKLHQSSKETMWLLNNLLDLYHSGQGHMDQVVEPIDLVDILEEQVAQASFLASVLGKSIDLNIVDTLPVLVEEISLHRLFSNLLHNAVRFAPLGETITISAQRKNGCAVLKITNPGEPLNEEELNSMFERFSKTAKRNKTYQTKGLGLYLCRKIVDLYNGTIDCKSDKISGTTFTITFPLTI